MITRSAAKRNQLSELASSVSPVHNEQQTTPPSSPAERLDIIGLGPDVLVIIFDLIQSTSPKTLQALSLVNRTFHYLATHAQARHLQLNLGPYDIQASNDRLKRIERNQLLSAISTLDVTDPGTSAYDRPDKRDRSAPRAVHYRELLRSITDFMPLMTGLKTLSWNYSDHDEGIPDCVFQALRSCPSVHLRAHTVGIPTYEPPLFGRNTRREIKKWNLTKLQGFANISHLRVVSTYTDDESCLATTRPLKQLLLSTPALRSLILDIHQPTGGCLVFSPPEKYSGFGFVGEESLPRLEELVLRDYPWGREIKNTTPQSWEDMFGRGYPGKCDEMDHWAENFDWSSLTRLETKYISFALKAMPRLTSLKEATFTGTWPDESTIRFYQDCPTALEVIGVSTLRAISLEGILRHGSNLRTLRIHTTESGTWAEDAMDDASLRAIRDSCPHIEELFLDNTRSGDDWPWSTFDIVASFPNLRHLSVCFDLGISYDGEPKQPYVTFSSVRTIFTYLLNQTTKYQKASLCKLNRFRVISGCPSEIGLGLRSSDAYWPARNSTQFVCMLSDRDDEIGKGTFEIICPGRWRKDIREGDTGGDQDDKDNKKRSRSESWRSSWRQPGKQAIRLANEGPLSRDKWDEWE